MLIKITSVFFLALKRKNDLLYNHTFIFLDLLSIFWADSRKYLKMNSCIIIKTYIVLLWQFSLLGKLLLGWSWMECPLVLQLRLGLSTRSCGKPQSVSLNLSLSLGLSFLELKICNLRGVNWTSYVLCRLLYLEKNDWSQFTILATLKGWSLLCT